MINFPTPTAVGEQFEDAASGNSWLWDGIAWIGTGGGGGGGGAAGGFPAGTRMAFQQAVAPTGWVRDTTLEDYAMRVVSGNNAWTGGGGSVGFTTAFAGGLSSGNTTLTIAQMPTHNHDVYDPGHAHNFPTPIYSNCPGNPDQFVQVLASGNYLNLLAYIDYNATSISLYNQGGGGAHSHTLPNFAVKYLDFIIATKS